MRRGGSSAPRCETRRGLYPLRALRDPRGGPVAHLAQCGMPDQRLVLGDQHVGPTVTVQIDEPEVGVARVAAEARSERSEGPPALGLVMLVEAREGAIHHHEVRQAVAGQVEELRRSGRQREIGLLSHALRRTKLDRSPGERAEIAFVEERSRLLGQDSRNSLAAQIDPPVGGAVDARGKVFKVRRSISSIAS